MDRSIFNSFGLRENPFSVNPDPRYLFLTGQTKTTLEALIQGVQSRQGLILLTGDVGTGKTTLVNSLLDRLQQNGTPTAFIFNSHLESRELFELMLADFGIPSDDHATSPVAHLNAWLLKRYRAGGTAVLIIDEAQGLPSHTIEEIRLLLNLETPNGKLLQIVLSGQSELDQRLKRPELRPLHQRISLRCKTMPMTLEETRGCIQHRLRIVGAQDDTVFTSEAIDSVYFYSRGIPRIINLLCENGLLKAHYNGFRTVSASMIENASREFQFDVDRPVSPLQSLPEVYSVRPNLIPMQSSLTKPPMTFAAAAGLTSDARQDAKTVPVPAPPPKASLVRSPNNLELEPRTAKAVPPPPPDTLFPERHETAKGENSRLHRFADVGEIIAELSAGAAAGAPVLVNSAAAKRSSNLAAVRNRKSISLQVRAKVFLLAFAATTNSEFRRLTHDLLVFVRSYYRRLSKHCVAVASPVIKRITTSFISWLKEPRPPAMLAWTNSKTRGQSHGRFSAVSDNLRGRAEPVVRWLQTPLRTAHRR